MYSVVGFSVINKAGHSVSYKIACALSKDSDQSVHPHILIRVFAGYSMGSQGSKASSGRQKSDQPGQMYTLI